MGAATNTSYPELAIALSPAFDRTEKYKIVGINENCWMPEELQQLLKSHYSFCTVETKEDALALVATWLPDLIITDTLMAVGGDESLSLRLKKHPTTCHIPVVMLTDCDDAYSRIRSFYLGADDYISLSVDYLELRIRLNNLIASRQIIRAGYQRQLMLAPDPVVKPSQNDAFLQRAKKVLEENLADPLFGTIAFAREMGMSQTCLYRRLMTVAGCSSNDFIRQYRLRKAADLLSQQVGNVGEIAFQVGFNSLSYFAKCFKQQYDYTPREYVRRTLRRSA